MRYNDWDVLLFPGDSVVPMKEFRVDCHLVHDIEFSASNGSTGLPTMTCFVPTLDAGTPFQISIHSWGSRPEVSQFTKTFSKHAELVQFEVRVFIDGCFVASAILDPKGTWPCQIYNTFGSDPFTSFFPVGYFTKTGDLDKLRFPVFQYDMLQQRGWSPADDLGRIRLVISEGFPRASVTVPVERVKNVAAFTFQYAPLSILEGSGLAWPSPSLWLHSPVPSSKPVPTYAPNDGALLHSHSPRRSKHKRAAAKERVLESKIPLHGDLRGSRVDSGPRIVSRRGMAPPHVGQTGRHGRTHRTPPHSLDWIREVPRHEQSSYSPLGSGKDSTDHQQSAFDTSMPDYGCVPHDGQGSWSYFDTKCQSDDFMDPGPGRFLHVARNKVPANTPASTSTDDSSTPGKGNPFLAESTHGGRVRFPVAGFMDNMMQRSTMGQPNYTPTLARNIPLPTSLSASVAGSRTCPRIPDGELMCSDPSCGCNSHTVTGTCSSERGLGGKQQYSPFMKGVSGSLIHLEAERSVKSSSRSGSNHARNSETDDATGRPSLESNVAPAQGQGQAPRPKGHLSKSVGSGGLTDEAIVQALAQA